jgi:site-specific recombinase XerD
LKPKTRAATERINFTERRIESLASPKRRIIYDEKVQALGLKLEPTGKKGFFWFRAVAGKPTWKTIGPWPDISLDTARQKAAEYNGKLAEWQKEGSRGPNPFETPRGELTLGQLIDDYIAKHIRSHAHHPDRAVREIRYVMKNDLSAWQNRKVSAIARKEVLDLHAAIGEKHKPAANKLLELLRAAINWAIEQQIFRGENPAAKIALFHKVKRTRFIQPNEMPKLFAALKTEPNRDVVDFINLSLWTGARKSDVLSMRWQDISLEDNRWLVPDPKNREPYQIALTPEAVTILKKRLNERCDGNTWVFPSYGRTGHVVDFKKRWKSLLVRAGLSDLRQHDLRRTLGSWQAGQGVSLQIIGKSLGHRSVAATQIYSQLNLDPVRESVQAATKAMIVAGRKKPKQLKAGSR